MATTPGDIEIRSTAIASVLSARLQMDKFLSEIAKGSHSLVSVLNISEDQALNQLYVVKVLESFKHIGKIRARQVLDELQIEHKKRISNLDDQERGALIEMLR